ncbi:MAG: hypothetical protein IJS67_03745 [Clostridia bacterium]|nr:hypothetical protein [Clostridia bacterium]
MMKCDLLLLGLAAAVLCCVCKRPAPVPDRMPDPCGGCRYKRYYRCG